MPPGKVGGRNVGRSTPVQPHAHLPLSVHPGDRSGRSIAWRARRGQVTLRIQGPGRPGLPWAPPTARGPCSPACWMREAGVEATGSAALRSRLAGAPVGGPGGRARAADPRSCPILSSRSCSRRSRSTSSGLRAAPCVDARGGLVSPARSECFGASISAGRHRLGEAGWAH